MGFATAPLIATRLRDDARLPPEHVPGRDRDAGSRAAASASRASRSTSSTSSSSSPRRRGGSWPGSGVEALRGARRPRRPARGRRRDRALARARARPVGAARSRPTSRRDAACGGRSAQDSPLGDALDWQLIEEARPALERGDAGRPASYAIRNVNRTVGGLLSHARDDGPRRGRARRRARSASRFHGSAGQSFGAWLAPGIELELRGDANDYVGKGLSGGVLVVRPPDGAGFRAEENVIVGNTVLYGATAGQGVRPRPRGRALRRPQLGRARRRRGRRRPRLRVHDGRPRRRPRPDGRNFAAGMSGGIAYVLDEDGALPRALQPRPRRARARGGRPRAAGARGGARRAHRLGRRRTAAGGVGRGGRPVRAR